MRHLAWGSAIALLAVAASCGGGKSWHTMQGVVWNTSYTIKYKSDRTLDDSILSTFRMVEMSLSPFLPDSHISLINRNEILETDSLIDYVFATSTLVDSLSGRAFDPTLSPLINLWGFGYEKSHDRAEPTDDEIEAALASVGIYDCRISDGMMIKKSPATTFNFSAITKGYACDLISGMLARNGVDDCMIEIGGEIALRGENDRRRPWRIMVEAPAEHFDSERTGMATLELTDCGVATSGNYRNYRESGTRRLGHTISPATGRPVETQTLSTSIIAPTCALADALATAAMAMDAGEALSMLDKFDGVSGIIVTADTVLTHGLNL